MINSYVDYVTGVDDPKTSSDRTLFERVSVSTLVKFIVFSVLVMSILTHLLTRLCSGETEWLGRMFVMSTLASFFTSFAYTHFKYIAMGQIIYSFGIYGIMSIYYCLFANQPPDLLFFQLSTPVVLQLTTCLLAGYHRDIDEDKKAGIKTICTILGKSNSIYFIGFLFFCYYLMLIFISLYFKNYLMLITLISVVDVYRLLKRGLNGSTQRFNFEAFRASGPSYFLYILSILIHGKIN
ncbi:hypothetical protein DFA_00632 [Cavenderia fasciculata]|uniref:UbiA prenyltransferase family protein n=1 Tax=Cavenderia fasciculata TaxID=261658 RepID=F4PSY0_CACFS|nr:uncharacterized protein DFA_00632 [Cavenderia fasciculata]EGG20769.1 hypothetical protein DFA_00632 [Cavenderia fasciculata]|eukprot:XP_004358619.1 hypothetical protein DFA_00632 [Cavenderia fasciculata]